MTTPSFLLRVALVTVAAATTASAHHSFSMFDA